MYIYIHIGIHIERGSKLEESSTFFPPLPFHMAWGGGREVEERKALYYMRPVFVRKKGSDTVCLAAEVGEGGGIILRAT